MISATTKVGNSSKQLRNEAHNILDKFKQKGYLYDERYTRYRYGYLI